MSERKLAGVTLFCALVLLSSLMHMEKLVEDRAWYFETYSYMPLWLATARYSFSWFQRVAGITAALLTLNYREWGRRLLLVIAVFTISTVYWKHPYVAVERHGAELKIQYPAVFGDYSLDHIATVATIGLILIDVLFQSAVIYYFTRREVREAFRKP